MTDEHIEPAPQSPPALKKVLSTGGLSTINVKRRSTSDIPSLRSITFSPNVSRSPLERFKSTDYYSSYMESEQEEQLEDKTPVRRPSATTDVPVEYVIYLSS